MPLRQEKRSRTITGLNMELSLLGSLWRISNSRMFDEKQRRLIRDSFKDLPLSVQLLLWERFIFQNSIQGVALKFRLSWDQADRLIEEGLRQLRMLYQKRERGIEA